MVAGQTLITAPHPTGKAEGAIRPVQFQIYN
jgi:hypothetical protein